MVARENGLRGPSDQGLGEHAQEGSPVLQGDTGPRALGQGQIDPTEHRGAAPPLLGTSHHRPAAAELSPEI